MLFLSTLFAAVGIGWIAWRWRWLRGTTLVAPARWALVVFALLPLGAWVMEGGSGNEPLFAGAEGIYLIITVATFCPALAVLGAKRPQNGPWQFVVVSFWLLLSLPGLRAALLADGSPVTLHAAPSWLLLALWGVSTANYLPTRHVIPGLLVAAGQFILAAEYMPLATWWPAVAGTSHYAVPAAAALFLAATLIVCLRPGRCESARALDRLWVDFRNAFGAVWGLRCQQRLNQSAEMYGWPVRLEWHGFSGVDRDELDADLERSIRNNFANLLRRFVSPEWIAARNGR